MKILHTADWHVGRTIRGRSRADEHEAVLAEIVSVADRERADVVLVTGDQFDTSAPPPDAERIVYGTLLALAETGAAVVVVAGNHDHPGRLAAVAPLLEQAGVRVAAQLARPDDGGVRMIEAGGHGLCVALVPFVSQRGIVRADDLMGLDADQHQGRYRARLAAVLQALCGRFAADTVNVVAAHLMVVGGTAGGSERAAHVVFDYAVPATVFPPSAHYAALGHLHRPQRIDAAAPVWYAGSPLQLDFGEAGQDKGVLMIDAQPGQPARVTQQPLSAGRRLSTLAGTLPELEALAGSTGDDHLRVVVEGEAVAGLVEQVRAWFPEVVDVAVSARDPRRMADPVSRRLSRSPHDLFSEYLDERGAADDRVVALFDDLLDETYAPDQA